MPEETTGTVTDEALTQATEQTQDAEAAPEETKGEVVDVSAIQKEINNLKSEIGRGGRALTEVSRIREEIATLKELLQNQTAERQTQQDTEKFVATVDDVKKVFTELELQKQREALVYNDKYLNEVARLALEDGLPDDQFGKLEEILATSIRGSKTKFKDPLLDAEINYLKASRLLNTQKKVNLKGDTPKGTGIGQPSQNTTKPLPALKLDPEAEAYAKAMGLKEEDIRKALG